MNLSRKVSSSRRQGVFHRGISAISTYNLYTQLQFMGDVHYLTVHLLFS